MRPLSEEDHDLIERYANNELAESELMEFKTKLDDEAFASHVQLYLGTEKAIATIYRNELRQELKKHLPSQADYQPDRKGKSQWYWSAAALVVISLGVGLYFFSYQKRQHEALFEAYFQAYPSQIVTRAAITSREDGFVLYDKGEYSEALPLLIKLRDNTQELTKRTHLGLMIANCYLEQNDVVHAKPLLEEGRKSSDPNIRQHADWYFALALIKNNKRNDARQVLLKIQESESIYSSQADQLLKSL